MTSTEYAESSEMEGGAHAQGWRGVALVPFGRPNAHQHLPKVGFKVSQHQSAFCGLKPSPLGCSYIGSLSQFLDPPQFFGCQSWPKNAPPAKNQLPRETLAASHVCGQTLLGDKPQQWRPRLRFCTTVPGIQFRRVPATPGGKEPRQETVTRKGHSGFGLWGWTD